MDKWKELNDFSMYEKRVPCVLCKESSELTLIGDHFKCSKCDHLFNVDGSPLPEEVACFCETCHPKKEITSIEDRSKKSILKKVKKAIKKVIKKAKKQI